MKITKEYKDGTIEPGIARADPVHNSAPPVLPGPPTQHLFVGSAGRTGNLMFQVASALGLANTTRRVPMLRFVPPRPLHCKHFRNPSAQEGDVLLMHDGKVINWCIKRHMTPFKFDTVR